MANIVRKDSFSDLFDFRRDFDTLFNRFLTGSAQSGNRSITPVVAVPPIEVWLDNQNNYHLNVALAGVSPSEVKVNLQGSTLTISGEHKSEAEKQGSDYAQREYSYSQFERIVVLPDGLDTEKLTAESNNGVLEITAPFRAAARPKHIEVKSPANASNQRVVSAPAQAQPSTDKAKSAGA